MDIGQNSLNISVVKKASNMKIEIVLLAFVLFLIILVHINKKLDMKMRNDTLVM